ncbi:hypothetical protein P43SY_007150 [Pythium insidiosum]|uniref:HTH CENPB-type domain-containing protein n=1 Tax=Pythium insidiosum TaxID=114742 RepID=A0AAD5M6H1_PYTIN|nr:hypothetical protein P43SY_007150 [Pythium insidiosum]
MNVAATASATTNDVIAPAADALPLPLPPAGSVPVPGASDMQPAPDAALPPELSASADVSTVDVSAAAIESLADSGMLEVAAPPPVAVPTPASMAKTKTRSTNLTHEQKRLICLHAKQNPTLTQSQLGKWAKEQFGLSTVPSQSSISHTLKRRHSFEHMKSEDWSSKRMRTVKYPELDTALANWFLYCQARQIRIQGDEIKAKAQLFFELMKLNAAEPPQFSNGWLHSFQSRHGFSRSPGTHNADLELLTTRQEFVDATRGFAPWDIYWMDETRLEYSRIPDVPHLVDPSQQMTIVFCCNTDGSDLMDPFFICPNPLDLSSAETASDGAPMGAPLTSAGPTSSSSTAVDYGFTYAYNKKVWMTPTIFREWLLAFDWKMHEENRNVVLILDSFSSHQVRKLTLKNVSVRFVGPTFIGGISDSYLGTVEHTVFSAVKRRYRKMFLEHALARQTAGSVDVLQVDAVQAIQWVLKCWRELPKKLVADAFTAVGIINEEILEDGLMTESEESVSSQIVELLKQLKLSVPAELADFIYPVSERVVEEELQDQDFVDCSLDASLGTTVPGRHAEPPRKMARLARMKKVAAGDPSAQNAGALVARRLSQGYGGPAGVTSAISDDEGWQAWADNHRFRSDEVLAVETTIRLASEMNCEPTTLLDLNRILTDLLQKRQTSDRATGLGGQTADMNAADAKLPGGVCRFSFGGGSTTI